MRSPLITVIIPCYNYEKFIVEAINSVQDQTYKNIELIVVNDGSTDNSHEIIKTAEKKHSFRYYNRSNHGIVATRNFSISKATGDFVIQLDADDTIPKDYVETLAKHSASSEADIYYTPAVNPANGELLVQPPDYDLDILKIKNYIHATSMFRRSVIEKYKYDQFLTDKGLEDWDINLAMCLDGAKAKLVTETQLNYTQHVGGVVSRGQRSRRTIAGVVAIKYILDKYIQSHPKEMGSLNWFSDNFGRLIQSNRDRELMNGNLQIKNDKLVEYADRMKEQFEIVSQRKVLRIYDRTMGYMRHPKSLYRHIKTKITSLIGGFTDESVEKKRLEVLHEDGWEETVFKSTDTNLKELTLNNLRRELLSLNDSLINWDSLVKSHKQAEVGKRVSIIILVLNNPEMTVRCIESVMEARTKIDFEMIVVDNGSNAPTIQELRRMSEKYPKMRLVAIDTNLNFALGNNVGFQFATGDVSVFLNNDTFVTDGWLDGLITPLVENQNIRAVQPTLLYPDDTIQCIGIGFSEKSPLGYAIYTGKDPNKHNVIKSRKLPAITAACLAVRSLDYARLKGFDPLFVNGQEDIDFCLRLTRGNKKHTCYCTSESKVYHDEGRTQGRGKRVLENRKKFIDRWGDSVQPNDIEIYTEDGYNVVEWKVDSIEGMKEEVEIYTPVLERVK